MEDCSRADKAIRRWAYLFWVYPGSKEGLSMNVPDKLFIDMESRKLSANARLLLIDALRRANRQYPSPIDDLKTKRAIRLVYRDGHIGMTRPAFVKARTELRQAGFLARYRDEKTNRTNRDWFWLQSA
jgi:hypothetical protein